MTAVTAGAGHKEYTGSRRPAPPAREAAAKDADVGPRASAGAKCAESVAACRRVPRLRDLTLAPPRSLRFAPGRCARHGGLRRPRRVPRAPYERVDAVPQPRRSRPSGAQGAGGCGRARFEPKRTDALPLARPRSPNLRKRLPSWSHCASSQVSGLSALWTRFSVTNCSCWQTP
jgi:hypothetical protein